MLAVSLGGGSDVVGNVLSGLSRSSKSKVYGPSMTDRIAACSTRASLGSLIIEAEGYTFASQSTKNKWQKAITKRLSGEFLA